MEPTLGTQGAAWPLAFPLNSSSLLRTSRQTDLGRPGGDRGRENRQGCPANTVSSPSSVSGSVRRPWGREVNTSVIMRLLVESHPGRTRAVKLLTSTRWGDNTPVGATRSATGMGRGCQPLGLGSARWRRKPPVSHSVQSPPCRGAHVPKPLSPIFTAHLRTSGGE